MIDNVLLELFPCKDAGHIIDSRVHGATNMVTAKRIGSGVTITTTSQSVIMGIRALRGGIEGICLRSSKLTPFGREIILRTGRKRCLLWASEVERLQKDTNLVMPDCASKESNPWVQRRL